MYLSYVCKIHTLYQGLIKWEVSMLIKPMLKKKRYQRETLKQRKSYIYTTPMQKNKKLSKTKRP